LPLTYALRVQVKEFKIEIKNKFYIKSITFKTFKKLNAQVPRKFSTFGFLIYAPKAQVNISQNKSIKSYHMIKINSFIFRKNWLIYLTFNIAYVYYILIGWYHERVT